MSKKILRFSFATSRSSGFFSKLIHFIFKQEARQCDETRFSTIQPSIDVTGIRNERWQ